SRTAIAPSGRPPLLPTQRLFLCYYTLYLTKLRTPRTTLFPTRRSSDLWEDHLGKVRDGIVRDRREDEGRRPSEERDGREHHEQRSEEHTSELQSPDHLVCRLLLEKKKQ